MAFPSERTAKISAVLSDLVVFPPDPAAAMEILEGFIKCQQFFCLSLQFSLEVPAVPSVSADTIENTCRTLRLLMCGSRI